MSSNARKWILAAAIAGALPGLANAATTVMDFDNPLLVAGQKVAGFYSGFTWRNAEVRGALGSGADYDPPPSGENAAIRSPDDNCIVGGTDCDIQFTSDLDIVQLIVAGAIYGQGGVLHVVANGQQLAIALDTNSSSGGCTSAPANAVGWSCPVPFNFDPSLHIRTISFDLPTGGGAIDSLSVTTAAGVTRVPEPGSFALVALALVGAAASRRKRAA